jgi:hypothetical protein
MLFYSMDYFRYSPATLLQYICVRLDWSASTCLVTVHTAASRNEWTQNVLLPLCHAVPGKHSRLMSLQIARIISCNHYTKHHDICPLREIRKSLMNDLHIVTLFDALCIPFLRFSTPTPWMKHVSCLTQSFWQSLGFVKRQTIFMPVKHSTLYFTA